MKLIQRFFACFLLLTINSVAFADDGEKIAQKITEMYAKNIQRTYDAWDMQNPVAWLDRLSKNNPSQECGNAVKRLKVIFTKMVDLTPEKYKEQILIPLVNQLSEQEKREINLQIDSFLKDNIEGKALATFEEKIPNRAKVVVGTSDEELDNLYNQCEL